MGRENGGWTQISIQISPPGRATSKFNARRRERRGTQRGVNFESTGEANPLRNSTIFSLRLCVKILALEFWLPLRHAVPLR